MGDGSSPPWCVALMFSLRQVENLLSVSGAVRRRFRGCDLELCLFGLAIARMRREAPFAGRLLASFGYGAADRLHHGQWLRGCLRARRYGAGGRVRWSIVLACAAWAVILTMLYFHGYEPVAQHSRPLESLHRPGELLLYAAMYLGSVIATADVLPAAVLGFVGMAATLAAAVRCHLQRGAGGRDAAGDGRGHALRRGCGLGDRIGTADVRFGPGSLKSLCGRQRHFLGRAPRLLVDRPARMAFETLRRSRRRVWRCCWASFILVLVLPTEQRQAKGPLAEQRFAQNESADLLMLGLDDRAVVTRAAWSDEDVERLVPVLRRNRISIFGTRDFEALGHPLADRAIRDDPDLCGGAIDVAEADASLGHDGVRLSGTAWDGAKRRLVRRVLLANEAEVVVGFGSGAEPGAARSAWRGFAVAPLGSRLVAYGLLSDGHVCRVGAHGVSDGASHTSGGAAPS